MRIRLGVLTECHLFAFRLPWSGRAIHRVFPTRSQRAIAPVCTSVMCRKGRSSRAAVRTAKSSI